MNHEEIFKAYIDPIPKFNGSSNFSSKELYDYFKNELDIKDIEPMNTIRFLPKYKEFVKDVETSRTMKQQFKEFSDLTQQVFDYLFPIEEFVKREKNP